MDSKKQSQTSISSEDFQGILESIGYSLIDCGDHWRTQAIYRDGNNKTAVKIYKNTGVWMDFVQNKGCMPFEALIRLTLKDDREVAKIIGNSAVVTETTYEPKQKIEMERYTQILRLIGFSQTIIFINKGTSLTIPKSYFKLVLLVSARCIGGWFSPYTMSTNKLLVSLVGK